MQIAELRKPLAFVAAFFAVTGCATIEGPVEEPVTPATTATRAALHLLPPPENRVDVAIYDFSDVTGQYKPEDFQTLSRAVSQGGDQILIDALRDTGDGSWFRVIERGNLSNLLQERRVIQEMRQIYLGEEQINPAALPPLLFAGVIIEGGVVGFDSNTTTGGAGAGYLGISARTEYRKDTITVNLRTVSVKTGEVLASVRAQKSILSTSVNAAVFRYIDLDEILELEAGLTTNEPSSIALTRAIEKALYSLIMEMAEGDYWNFEDSDAEQTLLARYRANDGLLTPAAIDGLTSARGGHAPAGAPLGRGLNAVNEVLTRARFRPDAG